MLIAVRNSRSSLPFAAVLTLGLSGVAFGQSTVKVVSAKLENSVSTGDPTALSPKEGYRFVWLRLGLPSASPRSFDLGRVSLITDTAASVAGVDPTCGYRGEAAPQFGMISAANILRGLPGTPTGLILPSPELEFRFGAGLTLTGGPILSVKKTPAEFCLVFVVPGTPAAARLRGLGEAEIQVRIAQGVK